MNYRGIETEVCSIPAGTPVEYKGDIGILKHDHDSYYGAEEPIFLKYERQERDFSTLKFPEMAASKPRYDSTTQRWTKDLPVDFKIKILTGPTADVLRRHVRDYIRKNATKLRFGGKVCSTGTDPEVFVLDGAGRLLPAYEFLPSKDAPTKPSAYWDGFQAEFRTQAGSCNANLADSVYAGLQAVLARARKKDKAARLTIQNVMEIPQEVISTAAEEHVNFGCEPSLNAYGLEGRPCPDPRMYPLRFAGGHIHFGYFHRNPKHFFPPIVKALDNILGVASVAIADGIDDPRRRIMYGLPGEYRLPKWGLEYRTLSNFWLTHPVIAFLVWEIARMAFDFARQGFADAWRGDQDETINIINTCDAKAARAVFERNEALFKALVARCFEEYRSDGIKLNDVLRNKAADRALSVIHGGLGSIIAEPDNLAKNWSLNPQVSGESWKVHAEGTHKQFIKVVAAGVQKV